jgi:hypothetical protein
MKVSIDHMKRRSEVEASTFGVWHFTLQRSGTSK